MRTFGFRTLGLTAFVLHIFANQAYAVNGVDLSVDDPMAKLAVHLTYSQNGKLVHCSGSLVGRDVVLTAAHCQLHGEQIYASFPNSKSSMSLMVIEKTSHPEYSNVSQPNRSAFDIALLKLSEAAPSDYPVVEVAKQIDGALDYEVVTLGFGGNEVIYGEPIQVDKGTSTRSATLSGAGALRNAKFRVNAESQTEKLRAANALFVQPEDPSQGVCPGDSGGPSYAVVDGSIKQVGVSSRVLEPCRGPFKAIDVSKFRNWILSEIQRF